MKDIFIKQAQYQSLCHFPANHSLRKDDEISPRKKKKKNRKTKKQRFSKKQQRSVLYFSFLFVTHRLAIP